MKRNGHFLVAGMLFGILAAHSPAAAQKGNPMTSQLTLPQIVSKMLAEHKKLRSWEIDVLSETHIPLDILRDLQSQVAPDSKRQPLLQETKTSTSHWAFRGNDLFMEKWDKKPDGAADKVDCIKAGDDYYIFYFANGKDDEYTTGQSYKQNIFGTYNPLCFGYRVSSADGAGQEVASELQSGNYSLIGTENDAKFGPLYLVEGIYTPEQGTYQFMQNGKPVDKVDWLRMKRRMWIAPDYGYLVVRQEKIGPIYTTDSPVKPSLMTTLTVREVQRTSGVWLPKEGEVIQYTTKGTVQETTRLILSNPRLNQAPENLFRPRFKNKMHFYNGTQNKMYYVDKNDKLQLDPRGVPAPQMAVAGSPYPMRWVFVSSCSVLLMSSFLGLRKWFNRLS